jgi:tetratricopeptide (TPR) repeat protein
MGAALLAAGKANEAIVCLNEALRTNASQAEIYENLGTAYTQLGKYEPAIQSWSKAVQLNPDSANVLNNLAWLLATTGDVSAQNANRAVELAQHACELTGHKNPGFIDTLAAAYAAADNFPEAVKTAEKAIKSAEDANEKDLAKEIQKRLELYKAGQPYHQK